MLRAAPDAVVHASAKAVGEFPVTLGSRVVVNPLVEFRALGGPIVVGERCVLEDGVIIENPIRPPGSEGEPPVLVIGPLNLVEVRARIVGPHSVGSLNVFEPMSVVQQGCTIGHGCVVGSTVSLQAGSSLGDEHVAFRLGEPGAVQVRPAKRLKEQHLALLTRYLEALAPAAASRPAAGSSAPAAQPPSTPS